jgi:plastocyanin
MMGGVLFLLENLMSMRALAAIAFLVAAVGAAACGSPAPSGGDAPAAVAAPPPPLPGNSVISGVVRFEGTAPDARVIRMSSDPLCMPEGPSLSEVILVGPDNGLQNVFLYVKDGLGDRTFQAPQTPVVLDQRGCRYSPHVFGVQVGQPVRIVNSDPTLHNVHAVPAVNSEFNFGQPLKGMESTRTFTAPEVMLPFRCDVHGWMSAFGGVVPHPFFAVSGADGRFEIQGLPEGTYTVEAWHERFGTKTGTVTVDGTAGATLDFGFSEP